MQNDPTTQLFLAFRAGGDTEALATLFDRTAPQLLILAMHWAGDADAAEDLVQQTFLRAMQHADRFDAGRPVRPWLAGICANLAMQRRDRRRRDPQPLDEHRDALPFGERDPAALAGDSETLALVTQALDAVPSAYRDALVLNLVHGLRAVDIAHSLGRSPGTVRSQLKRGAEHLRRLLPKTLAAPMAAALCRADGLSQVRATVLRAASPAAATAAGWPALLWLVAALLLGVIPVALWRTGLEGGDAREAAVEAPAAPPTGAGTTTPASAPAPAEVRRARPPAHAELTGQCVAEETGAPLPGCTIAVLPADGLYTRDGLGRGKWHGRSDDRGRFSVPLPETPAKGVAVLFSAPGRAAMVFEHVDVRPRVDLGRLALPIGIRVRGRVTDTDGSPVPHHHCYLQRTTPARPGPGPWPLRPVGLTTFSDVGGAYEIPHLLAAGEYAIQFSLGRQPARPVRLVLAPPAAPHTVTLDIELPALPADHLLTGRAVDTEGQAWRGEILVARSSERDSAAARTTADGYFTFLRTPSNGSDTTTIDVSRPFRIEGGKRVAEPVEVELAGGPLATRWGARDVEVVVRRVAVPRAATLTLQVVRADTGAPVTRYAVRFFTAAHRDAYADRTPRYVDHAIAHGGDHSGGTLALPGVMPVEHFVAVYPDDRALDATHLLRVVPDASGRHVVRLLPKTRLDVQVVSANGTPRAGTRVQLIRPEDPGKFTFATHAFPAATSYAPGAQVVDEARTDTEGRAALSGGARPEPYVVRVFGTGHRDGLVGDVVLPDTRTLRVVCPAGATVRGRLGPPAALAPLWPGFPAAAGHPVVRVLAETGGALWPLGPREPAAVGADGRFVLDGIPPGRWRLRVEYRDPQTLIPTPRALDLPPVYTLDEGTVRDVEASLPDRSPGTLRGVVLLDGQPLADAKVNLAPERGFARTVQTGADGALPEVQLPPGRYRIKEVPDRIDLSPLVSEEAVDIPPGRAIEQRFELWSAAATVQLVAADGETPAAKATVWVGVDLPGAGARTVWGHRATRSDGNGGLTLTHLPPKFHLKVVDDSGRTRIVGPFDRPRRTARFTLRVVLKDD